MIEQCFPHHPYTMSRPDMGETGHVGTPKPLPGMIHESAR